MVEYYNFKVSPMKDNKYIITESLLNSETLYSETMNEKNTVKWNEKILNIPYIDEDINYEEGYTNLMEEKKIHYSNYSSPISSTNGNVHLNSDVDYDLTYDKINNRCIKDNNFKKSLIKHKNFNSNHNKFHKNIGKKKCSIDYIQIYLNSIYNDIQHPMHYTLKKVVENYKFEQSNTQNELLYQYMINLFKSEQQTCKMSRYIESIMKNKKHPLNASLCSIRNKNISFVEEILNNKNLLSSKISMSINSIQSITGINEYNETNVTSFSNSQNAFSMVSFAQSFLTLFVETDDDDDDILIGGQVAAEDDIDKDNWNNFQWNGQERPSLKELGADDVPKSFWNSEIWNNNDFNQSSVFGKNSEMLEYCGAKGHEEEDDDVVATDNVNIQDDYLLILEDDIIKVFVDELESCYYEIS